MRQTAQQLVPSVLEDDGLGDHRAQPGHAVAEPFRNPAAVKRQIGAARTLRNQCAPVATTPGPASGCRTTASPTNNGSSSGEVTDP